MIFSTKDFDINNVQIFIDNNDIPPTHADYNVNLVNPITYVSDSSETPAIKFLGVYIDRNLNFKYHTRQILNKISKAMYFIRSAKNFLTLPALKSLYYSLIHCHLIYAL